MKITNKKYKNLALANEDDRGENFILDFIISSTVGVLISYVTFKSLSLAFLVYILVRFIYYFGFEFLSSMTPGKYHTQTKVVDIHGNKPTLKQLIIRNISRFISMLSGISDDERAIHDNLSNTFVIKNTELKKIEVKQPLILIYYLSISCYYIYSFSIKAELSRVDKTLLVILVLTSIYGFFTLVKRLLTNKWK